MHARLLFASVASAGLLIGGPPSALGQAPATAWPGEGQSLEEALSLIDLSDADTNSAALAPLEETLGIARASGDRTSEARLLTAIASARFGLKESQRALELQDEALRIARELGDRELLRTGLNRQGVILDTLGRRQEAVASYGAALELLRSGEDEALRAQVLSNLGSSLSSIGEMARALEVLGEAVALRRRGASRDVEGQTLLQLGRVHAALGDEQRALALYREALPLHRAAGHRRHEADALNNIGTALAALGRLDEALASYAEALPIYREIQNAFGEGAALNNSGWAYDRKGDGARAVESFGKAVALFREIGTRGNEAQVLTNLGRALAAQGESEAALRSLEVALTLRREVKDPSGEAQTLYYMAKAERDRGRLAEARESVESALARVEHVRSATPGPRLRASYLATVQDYYRLQIDVLMLLHRERPGENLAGLALESSERARARSLLDLLAESGADIRGDADKALVEQEASLRRKLSARAEDARLLGDKATAEEKERAAREIEETAAELEAIEGRLRATSPRYAALAHPRPAGLVEIQGLLDDGTVLLEYSLGEERSYLWAVTRDALQVHELSPRARIEDAARALHERLRSPGPIAEVTRAAAALAALVLPPATTRLAGRRLVVVADGALEYVPFDVLPEGGSPEAAPLVAAHEVVRVPSASVLAMLRQEASGRARAPRDVAVLADPVFGPPDARLTRPPAGSTAPTPSSQTLPAALGPVVRSIGFTDGRLPRLPGTRREASAILSLVAPGRGLQALDFDASRDLATGGELRDYRIVHFATHGILDSERPELSGIVLSLVDREGRPRDGFLRLHDLYNLKLAADLVVLSACRTALGREVRGEGLVGLTRGFMYAGVPRVMASLWTVDDRATAELMSRFYGGLLGPQKLDPPAALRAAQQALRAERRWQHPYYWSGFVLHGDWK